MLSQQVGFFRDLEVFESCTYSVFCVMNFDDLHQETTAEKWNLGCHFLQDILKVIILDIYIVKSITFTLSVREEFSKENTAAALDT